MVDSGAVDFVAGRGPVGAVLPDLCRALATDTRAVLIAPPGAGKTTMVAPVLLDEPWCTGALWLLVPRRLAARAAAERIAELAGERVGGRVGYATRLDSRHGSDTRLLIMTHGLFRSRIVADPELTGVSGVLFDEVHERSVDSDFGLALALDAQDGLRPDLRLIAMSATIDGARFAEVMAGAAVIESAGVAHPLDLIHVGRDPAQRLTPAMLSTLRRALAERTGDALAFVPTIAEVERLADEAARAFPDMAVHALHGGVDPAAQRAALRRDPDARRKIVVATSIAETSVTIDGVRIVVDSGLARRPRFDRGAGIARLVTERASQAAVTQRAGRAARQDAGAAYRLWEEAATRGMPPYDPPEILESDLAPLVLDAAAWGVTDPAALPWIDAPPASGLSVARRALLRMGAIDADGHVTPRGRAIAALPTTPALGHMMLEAAANGQAERGAELVVLLGEAGLGGRHADLERRWAQWRRDRGPRADAARGLARRLADLARRHHHAESAGDDERHSPAALLAIAFPDRVARRRRADADEWVSAGGGAFRLDPADPLATHEWLVVAEAQGPAGGARIAAGAGLSAGEVTALIDHRAERVERATYDPVRDRVDAEVETRIGAIRLSRAPLPGAANSIAARLAYLREEGLHALSWSDRAAAVRDRARFAGLDLLDEATLLARADEWLPPLLASGKGLRDLSDTAWDQALQTLVPWADMQAIDRTAPARFTTPAGTTHAIDYAAEAGPSVTARVQAFYGLARHPTVGQPAIPLVLNLTSPAGRPVQTTRDLPGFWRGSWADVRRDMRGRYPKHDWPEDPTTAVASLRTKAAQARGSS